METGHSSLDSKFRPKPPKSSVRKVGRVAKTLNVNGHDFDAMCC